MGMIWALIVIIIVLASLFIGWRNKYNPLPEPLKKKGEVYFVLCCVFLLLSL